MVVLSKSRTKSTKKKRWEHGSYPINAKGAPISSQLVKDSLHPISALIRTASL
jgi:hypothetical protein